MKFSGYSLGHRWDAAYAGAAPSPRYANPHTGGTFFLGTDVRGHDVLVRMLAGARISITIGFIATGIAFVIGMPLVRSVVILRLYRYITAACRRNRNDFSHAYFIIARGITD